MRSPVGSYVTLRANGTSNAFGLVRTQRDGSPRPHQGWDIAAIVGSPIYAIANGTIEFVETNERTGGDYGLQVCLRFVHKGQTLYALYAHLLRVDVAARQQVKEGDRLGLTGQTGNARGQHHVDAHLHFEIRTVARAGGGLGGRVDPMFVLGAGPVMDSIFSDMKL